MSHYKAIKTIVINSVGGNDNSNVLAWQSVLFIAEKLKNTKIKVIHLCEPLGQIDKKFGVVTLDSEHIELARKFGIDEVFLLKHCQGNHILGDIYQGWSKQPQDFALVNGDYGVNFNNIEFQHYLTKADKDDVQQYSLAALMAQQQKFVHPVADKKSILSTYCYQMNVDTTSYVQALRKKLETLGIEVISVLPNDLEQESCFFVDCTISQSTQTAELDNIDTQDLIVSKISTPVKFKATYLVNDSSPRHSANVVNTFNLGWTKTTFLRSSRIVECYSSDASDHQKILSQLWLTPAFAELDIKDIELLGCHQLQPHNVDKAWINNHLKVGQASFELEALGINSLSILHQELELWFKHFPQTVSNDYLADFYNQTSYQARQTYVDFVQCHYQLSQWRKGEFWQYSFTPSEILNHCLVMFKQTGVFPQYEQQVITETHWVHFLLGFGCLPEYSDPLLQNKTELEVSHKLDSLAKKIEQFFHKIPSYQQYLNSNGL